LSSRPRERIMAGTSGVNRFRLSVKYGKPVYDVDARWHKTRCPLFFAQKELL
jgi:hypothetical protein